MRRFETRNAKVTHSNPEAIKLIRQRFERLPDVAIGFPRGKATSAQYPDGTPLVDVAFWNNYGTFDQNGQTIIPSRPFMTYSAVNMAHDLKRQIISLTKMVRDGKKLADDVANLLGAKASAIMKRTIRDLDDPPNAEYTIQKKKSDNPLVDTGFMIQSVTWDVRHPEGD